MKDKIYNFAELIADSAKSLYSFTFLIVEILLLFLRVALQINIALPALIIGIVALLLFIICKDASKENKHRYTYITLYTIIMAATATCLSPLFGSSKVGCLAYAIITLLAMGIIAIVIAVVPNAKIAFNTIASKDFYKSGQVKGREPGDALLGYEISPRETWKNPDIAEGDPKKPVIIPNKDRYVHMLALGATGTGKTSQILLPMIYNDIKDNKLGVIVLEPKGDFAEKVYALATRENRKVVYFNPVLKECPYLNPLRGKEVDVIEDMVTTFGAFDSDSSQYFRTNNENLLRKAIKVIKRLYGDDATLLQLEELIGNIGGKGQAMIKEFDRLSIPDESTMQENKTISAWFREDYFTGISGQRGSTKTYEQTSGIRNQVSKLVSNKYLRKVLNPPKTSELKENEYIDFDRVLRNGEVLALTSNQGALRDLSTYLGYFMILQLESAVFRRPGNENTRRGCVVCIDEFQTYSNPSFADMLTQGRSYRVACVLATQNRGLIGMNSGNKAKSFTELVSTNARNFVLFPDANIDDAKYYSQQFGETLEVKEDVSYSRQRFMANPLDDRENVRTTEKYETRFTASDIIYQPFGQVISSIISGNTRQLPVKTKIEFIPKDVNDEIESFLADFKLKNEIQEADVPVENIAPPAISIENKFDEEYEILGKDEDINISFDDETIELNGKSLSSNKSSGIMIDPVDEDEEDDF